MFVLVSKKVVIYICFFEKHPNFTSQILNESGLAANSILYYNEEVAILY